MSYFLAPALVALRAEIDARYPHREKTSDGWIGDTSHQARPSDHNPDWSDGGVVRAIDIDITDMDDTRDLRTDIIKACVGDPRVWYVISNGIIYSRTYGWAARKYTGSNPHDKHVHVSILGSGISDAEALRISRDTSRWLEPIKRRTKPRKISASKVVEQMRFAADGKDAKVKESVDVRRFQRAINQSGKGKVVADGVAGEQTLNTWAAIEKSFGTSRGRPRVPDARHITRLAKGRFEIVK